MILRYNCIIGIVCCWCCWSCTCDRGGDDGTLAVVFRTVALFCTCSSPSRVVVECDFAPGDDLNLRLICCHIRRWCNRLGIMGACVSSWYVIMRQPQCLSASVRAVRGVVLCVSTRVCSSRSMYMRYRGSVNTERWISVNLDPFDLKLGMHIGIDRISINLDPFGLKLNMHVGID